MADRVLVCGSRDWGTGDLVTTPYKCEKPQYDARTPEAQILWAFLQGVYDRWEGFGYPGHRFTLIEGAAPGADSLAWVWALNMIEFAHAPLDHLHYPANWKEHGKAAGPIRNKLMLTDGKPDLVLAFTHDFAASKGTKNMVNQARKAGVETYVIG